MQEQFKKKKMKKKPMVKIVTLVIFAMIFTSPMMYADNIAIGATVSLISSGGHAGGATGASHLADGNYGTYDQVYNPSAIWEFDLHQAQTVDSLVYVGMNNGTSRYLFTDYEVLYKSASNQWEQIVYETGNTSFQKTSTFSAVTGRYFRFHVIHENWGDPAWLEFELYEATQVPEPTSVILYAAPIRHQKSKIDS